MSTAIVIVNWNGWQDTARCLEACARLEDFTGSIFVCDNGSTDGSVERLKAWAAGDDPVAPDSEYPELAALTTPASTSSLRPMIHGSPQELGASLRRDGAALPRAIYLIESGVNSGFAGGNNRAIELALIDPRFDLFWLLNADAVPDPHALIHLQRHCAGRPAPLVSGSVLLEYWRPGEIQACGGWFKPRTMTAGPSFEGAPRAMLDERPETLVVDYPVGASLVLNRSFLERCGLLEEAYFLYFEEIDLSLRVPAEAVTVCTRSLVYHKGGKSTGGGKGVGERSRLADFCYLRARIILARKIGLSATLAASLASLYSIASRVAKGRFDLAWRSLPALWGGFRARATERHELRRGRRPVGAPLQRPPRSPA